MNIASIIKTTIVMSVNYIIEMWLIGLDNDLNNFIPFRIKKPHAKKSTIKLRNLMPHCSGIIDRQEIDLYHYPYDQDYLIELRYLLRNYSSING